MTGRFLRSFRPAVIFDVGANIGQSTMRFAATYPDAAIYAFEPVATVYDALKAAAAGEPRVQAFNLALGRRSGSAHVTRWRTSVTNRIVSPPTVFERGRTEGVAMASGDEFCTERHVEHIGFLKVDTEGHDLDVLVGFQHMLAAGRIDLLEAEVGMNPENRTHAPFEAVKAYLEPFGYYLFYLHDMAMDVAFSGRPVLRRANAMFVSRACVEANRVEPEKERKKKRRDAAGVQNAEADH